jgi:hypothetical protein
MKAGRVITACFVLFAAVGGLSAGNLTGRKIVMIRNHKLYAGGKYKYTAKAGETLYVVKEKPCKRNPSQTCLMVRHRKYGIGFAKKSDLLK